MKSYKQFFQELMEGKARRDRIHIAMDMAGFAADRARAEGNEEEAEKHEKRAKELALPAQIARQKVIRRNLRRAIPGDQRPLYQQMWTLKNIDKQKEKEARRRRAASPEDIADKSKDIFGEN
jgi:hypothetical protein